MASPQQARPAKKVLTERQSFWRAAIIMTSGHHHHDRPVRDLLPGTERDHRAAAGPAGPDPVAPQIIPNPADGRAPTNPGDPGGWEQVSLFFVMVTGMLTVGGLASARQPQGQTRSRGLRGSRFTRLSGSRLVTAILCLPFKAVVPVGRLAYPLACSGAGLDEVDHDRSQARGHDPPGRKCPPPSMVVVGLAVAAGDLVALEPCPLRR